MGGPGGDVMTPTRPARSKRSQKRRPLANGDINSNNKSSLDAAGSEQFTEAEQLLMRLKALWLVGNKVFWFVRILKPSHWSEIEHEDWLEITLCNSLGFKLSDSSGLNHWGGTTAYEA